MHEKLIQFFMHDLILELYVRLIKRTVTKFSVLFRSTLYVSCNKTGLEPLQQMC